MPGMLTTLLLCCAIFVHASAIHRFYALRHGESLANVEGRISSDPAVACVSHGLSTNGWDQAEKAAEAVCHEALKTGVDGVAIVSSDFRRAFQTAQTVRSGVLSSGLRCWPETGVYVEIRLRERNFGDMDGKADTCYNDVWVEDAADATHEKYGVESVVSVLARAQNVVKSVSEHAELQSGKWMVVLVAHGDVLQILQTGLSGMDPRNHRSIQHLPTATLRSLTQLARNSISD